MKTFKEKDNFTFLGFCTESRLIPQADKGSACEPHTSDLCSVTGACFVLMAARRVKGVNVSRKVISGVIPAAGTTAPERIGVYTVFISKVNCTLLDKSSIFLQLSPNSSDLNQQ